MPKEHPITRGLNTRSGLLRETKTRIAVFCILLSPMLAGCGKADARRDTADIQPVKNETKLSYNRDIRPILSDKCFACHGPDAEAREAELRLDVAEDGEDFFGAYLAIEPGDPKASELIDRIDHNNAKFVMPPPDFGGVTLNDKEKSLLRHWIEQGAQYEAHWAFAPITKPSPPPVVDTRWPRNAIDAFVLHELEQQGIKPSPAAPQHTQLRRVSLDLTGLPPAPEAISDLDEIGDPDKAYEAYVDGLLASPRFGERMASIWLDAARYADTNGYLHDHQRSMWPWRDWVIRAYNDNLPYDVFLRDQIAGDLLPNPTTDQLIATGFNRNHGITTEGGSIDEEFRVEYAADRTNTMGAAILSMTLECARCHDHKYDPISQEDYFSLFAYFNSLENEDPAAGGRAKAHAPFIQDKVSGQQVMVMREAAEQIPAYVLDRGAYDAPIKDRPVSRRVPRSLGKVPDGAPANRLGLAQWMTADDNPLTARVEVNRIWQTLFGVGLVKTSEDFGLQGEWPSHPDLLDHLARHFIETGWDRKALIRLIVTSATYRQSSHARPELAEHDPENRLLARMSRLRLPAETIRDQALSASGLLIHQIGGPGVRPYQPDGLWREGGNEGSNTRVFRLGKGGELYRRSVYTFFKRTSPPPQMVLLDSADRNACAVRRSSTNTALQALLMMNDTQQIEAARHLAARAWRSSDADGTRLDNLYRYTLSRSPRQGEATVLLNGIKHYRVVYKDDLAAAQALISQGESPTPDIIPADELAAWTMLANTVLNLDETITRP
ncbi:MAG: PSD1 and planctomycete cytochrome C domain-containing protein [Phycisphaeraceae bacterium]|nr:PSD1 and planctomycete cytochrome C domain-containing protein [Phycisphaeraceae bacterium]